MSESELRKYRLTSQEEPSDELMAALMERAAEAARQKKEAADKAFWKKLHTMTQAMMPPKKE